MRVRANSTATHRKRSHHQRPPEVATRARQQAHQQTEKSVIEAEVTAEKKKRQQRFRRTQAAVLAHRVVDPVTGARVPQDSAT